MFANSLANPVARLAYITHAAAARLRMPSAITDWLRQYVSGRFDDGKMTLELRPSTWDAWTAHPGHEPETHKFIAETFTSCNGVMVDVGAYIGSFSLRYRHRFAAIHAFEASTANFRALTRNVASNDGAVFPHHAAVADGAGMIRLYLDNPDTNSIYGTGPFEEVPVMRLDDWWRGIGKPPVDLIKIDVEGAETDVIASAADLLTTGPTIIAEANDSAHAKQLASATLAAGYHLVAVLDRANHVYTKNAGPQINLPQIVQ